MTRTLQMLICAVLVGVVRGPAVADGWTSSLGRYTRALAEQCALEQAEAAEAQSTLRWTDFDWTFTRSGFVYNYYDRGLHYSLDRSRHQDYRYEEQRVASLTNHAFPRAHSYLGNMRSPDFYMEHQSMQQDLESREFYRTWHYAWWHERYGGDRPYFRYP